MLLGIGSHSGAGGSFGEENESSLVSNPSDLSLSGSKLWFSPPQETESPKAGRDRETVEARALRLANGGGA